MMKVLLIGALVKGAKAANNVLESATIAVERNVGSEVKVSYVNLRAYGKSVETIVSLSNEAGDGIVMITGILDVEEINSMQVPVVTVESVKVMPSGTPHVSVVYGIGNLTRDAEIRKLSDQWRVASVGIASNRKVRGVQKTSFFTMSLFGKVGEDGSCRADNTAPHWTLGKGLSISGQLDVQIWNDQTDPNKQRSSVNIIIDGFEFLPSGKRDDSQKDVPPPYTNTPKTGSVPSYVNQTGNLPEIDINEDEIPF